MSQLSNLISASTLALAQSSDGGTLIMLPIIAFVVILSLAMLAFWIWIIVDCATNEPSEGNDKVIWILVIVLLQGLGALIYFFARRPKRKAEFGR